MSTINLLKMDLGTANNTDTYRNYWLGFAPANCIPRSIPLDFLLTLYDSCSYHSTPIHKKARAAFARGIKVKHEPITLQGWKARLEATEQAYLQTMQQVDITQNIKDIDYSQLDTLDKNIAEIKKQITKQTKKSPLSALEDIFEGGTAYFFTACGADRVGFGEFYAEIVRAGNGQVLRIRHLPAITMWRHIDEKRFMQVSYNARGQMNIVEFDADEIIHVKSPIDLRAGFYGRPDWFSAREDIQLLTNSIKYNSNYFKNNGMPNTILLSNLGLSEKAKNEFKEYLQSNFNGVENSHNTLYADFPPNDNPNTENTKFEVIQLNPRTKDAEFVKQMILARDSIVTAHEIPPRLMNIIDAGQLGGSGEANEQFKQFLEITIEPDQALMLAAFKQPFNELGISTNDIEFDTISLLKEEDTTQLEPPQAVTPIIPTQEQAADNEEKGVTKSDRNEYTNLVKHLEDKEIDDLLHAALGQRGA